VTHTATIAPEQRHTKDIMDITITNGILDNIISKILASGNTIGSVADSIGIGRSELRGMLAGGSELTVGVIGQIGQAIGVNASVLVDVSGREPWDPELLSGLMFTVVPDDRGRELVTWEDDGLTFRHAFEVELNLATVTATVRMFAGAATGDLDIAKRALVRVQQMGFDCHWQQETRDGADCRILSGLQHGEGGALGYPQFNNELRACEDAACVEGLHEWVREEGQFEQFGSCNLAAIEHPDGYYVVHGSRPRGEKWDAWVVADSLPDGHAGIEAARALVNDFAWMQGECDKLNEAAA